MSQVSVDPDTGGAMATDNSIDATPVWASANGALYVTAVPPGTQTHVVVDNLHSDSSLLLLVMLVGLILGAACVKVFQKDSADGR